MGTHISRNHGSPSIARPQEERPAENRPAEVRPPEPARPTGYSGQSQFEPARPPQHARALGTEIPSSTLRTEQRGDGSANCLEHAAGIAQPGDQVVLFQDSRDAVGHAVVQHPDGTVTDPNLPDHRFRSMEQWQDLHPRYHSPTSIPDTQLEQVLGTPPGPARDALLQRMGLDGVADRAVADGPITRTVGLTFEPRSIEAEAGRIGGSITSGPYSGVEVELSWDPSRPGPDGRFPVTLEVMSEVGTMSQGELRVGPFGAEGGTAAGIAGSRTYTLNLTQAELERLQTGQLPLPTLADPLSMPPGSQLMMSAEVFGSSNLSASFGPLSMSDEVRASAGYSFGVERLEGDRVRLTVGPTEALERTQGFGLGFEVGSVEVSAELSRTTEVSNAALASVELDLSTPEGQAAYEQFLLTRNLPPDGPGVSNRTTSQVLSVDQAAAAGLTVGPLSVGGALWSESTSMVVTQQGGVTTATVSASAAYSGNNIATSYRFENGQPVFDSLSFEVTAPGGQRAMVQVEGMEGVESLQQVAFSAAQANLFADWAEAGTPDQLKERFASDERLAALALEPGDPGFSGQAWLEAYNTLDSIYGGLPDIPPVAMAAIRAGEYPDAPADRAEALRVDLVGTLRAEEVNAGVFEGVADMHSPEATRSWLDSGLGSVPGLQVTLPPSP